MGTADRTKYGKTMRTEKSGAQFIPYACHLDEHTIKLIQGGYVQVIRVDGLSHETTDTSDLNSFHEERNNLLRQISTDKLSIWFTTIRRKQNRYPGGNFEPGFASDLNERYKEKVSGADMYVNEMYITLVYREENKSSKVGQFFMGKKSIGQQRAQEQRAITRFNEISKNVVAAFARYNAVLLGTYEHNDILFSRPYEFFGFLLNGYHQQIPITRVPAAQVLVTSRMTARKRHLEIQGIENDISYRGALGIKYPSAETRPGMLDKLLELNTEFVLTQSFTFLNKKSAAGSMLTQRDRMRNSGELASEEAEEIASAATGLVRDEYAVGIHHLSLMVTAESTDVLGESLADAATIFGGVSLTTAREDLGLESAFYAQLPGNHGYRPRKMLITSRNLSGFASMHNFPSGRIDGNWWGDCMALVKSSSGNPYYINLHLQGNAPLGNATVIGPSGTGKTVLMGFTLAQAQKYKPTVVYFDKDRGAEICIRALRGSYSTINQGDNTGFNPLQLEPNSDNLVFIRNWLKLLATSGGDHYSVRDAEEVDGAVKGLMRLDKNGRTLTALIQFLDSASETGVAKRLKIWTNSGEHGWAFDNPTDSLELSNPIIGIDLTQLLDSPVIRTPMLFYFFHRIKHLIKGQPFMLYLDEGWKLLDDPIFVEVLKNYFKTIRKMNGVIVFGTNSADDAAASAISSSIIEQSPTGFFFPNMKAAEKDYMDGFKLSKREFQLIQTMGEKSRQCLIRHGEASTIIKLDLGGMDDDIAVLSGTTDNVKILEGIREEVGDDPDDWMPLFLERRT